MRHLIIYQFIYLFFVSSQNTRTDQKEQQQKKKTEITTSKERERERKLNEKETSKHNYVFSNGNTSKFIRH